MAIWILTIFLAQPSKGQDEKCIPGTIVSSNEIVFLRNNPKASSMIMAVLQPDVRATVREVKLPWIRVQTASRDCSGWAKANEFSVLPDSTTEVIPHQPAQQIKPNTGSQTDRNKQPAPSIKAEQAPGTAKAHHFPDLLKIFIIVCVVAVCIALVLLMLPRQRNKKRKVSISSASHREFNSLILTCQDIGDAYKKVRQQLMTDENTDVHDLFQELQVNFNKLAELYKGAQDQIDHLQKGLEVWQEDKDHLN